MTSCYGCTERHIGCHATCERYAAEAEKYKQRRDDRMRNKLIEDFNSDSMRVPAHRNQLRRKKGKK